MAIDAGANAIGLVFYPKSSRAVTVANAAKISTVVPPFVAIVALFVNETAANIQRVLEAVPVDIIQFHGDEPAEFCEQFNRPYIKAIRVKPGLNLPELCVSYARARGLLLDTWKEGVPGGTGESFDWQLASMNLPLPVIAAGGLSDGNVAAAIKMLRPSAVDVSGGVESTPGVKDGDKITRFVAAKAHTNYSSVPDAEGRFGIFGGKFVAETLMSALAELEELYTRLSADPAFHEELDKDLANYVGRPSPLYEAVRWSDQIGGARIFLKREDLNHTGAHKVNNTIGQALLAKYMGKPRVIAETGAGQHGVATATIAARLGLECHVFMGEEDIKRQALNVYRMRLLGAEVIPVTSGSKTLKDAMNEAMRDWVTNVDNTYYIIGTVAGPHPYPLLVRDFQSVIGREARAQSLEQTGRLPDALVACVGGGSNAIGLFHPFLEDEAVAMYGVEAGGLGVASGSHAAPLTVGTPGILHGNRTYLMQDEDGQIMPTHSISAGLDYPGVGPEHSWLKDIGRVEYVVADDQEALSAFHTLTRVEGIMPALESSHALAYAEKLAATMTPDQMIIVNLSGRGDKDIHTVAELDGIEI
ncbi:UNVERIFIED_CONTAM: hypothetical protein GTU68_009728 [Idotea baltica]|nr:hypothetical protein [Idotea baltica]